MAIPPPKLPACRRWLKVPFAGSIEVIVMSEALASLVHWVGLKAEPCSGSSCPHCALGLGRQTRYTFLVWHASEPHLFEVRDSHYAELVEFDARNGGSMIGARLALRRSAPRRNARLVLSYLGRQSWHYAFSSAEVLDVLQGRFERLRGLPADPLLPSLVLSPNGSLERVVS